MFETGQRVGLKDGAALMEPEEENIYVNLEDLDGSKQQRPERAVFCPAGWRRFGCSCYLLSSSMNSWEGSRAQCLLTGSDLVTISSQEEMEFLDQLGAQLKFWIGLKEASRGSGWKWTDGSSPGVTFWTWQTSWTSRTQSCAAFNRGGRSWSEEWCSQLLQWVCEKKASTSGRLQ